MPPSSLTADIERLQASVNSLLALIKHCQSSLSLLPSSTSATTAAASTSTSDSTLIDASPPLSTSSIPPLSLLHDTASLAKAHTTKLALLLTQSTLSSTCRATIPILSTLQTSVIPPLLTSLELLYTQHHGKVLIRAVSCPISEILQGIEEMVGGPLKNLVDASLKKGITGKEEPDKLEKETVILPSTGKIWSACDRLVGMKSKGLVGVVIDRLKTAEETVKDATEELERYCKKHTPQVLGDSSATSTSSSTDNSDDDDDDDDDEDDDDFWDNDDVEFPSSTHPKKKRKSLPPHIITSMTSTIKRLKTLLILFKAIHKRRLTGTNAPSPDPATTISPNKDVVVRLNFIVDFGDELVILVDDVIGEYYEIDGDSSDDKDIDDQKKPSPTEQSLIQKSLSLASLVQKPWDENTADTAIKLFEECAKALQR